MSTQKRSDNSRRLLGIGVIIMLLGVFFFVVGDGFSNREVLRASVSLPIADAETATLTLRPGIVETTVRAGAGEGQLLDADIEYYDAYHLTGSPGPQRNMLLEHRPGDGNTFSIGPFGGDNNLEWDVRLNSGFPLAIDIDGDVGDFEMDLRDLNLTALDISTDVGDVELDLPMPNQTYTVTINSDVGNVEVNVPAAAAVHIIAAADVGRLDIDDEIPERSRGDGVVGEAGEWQTDDFDAAEAQIIIEYSGDVGDLTVDVD